MSRALSTVELVQNPALGALLLWQFGKSYQEEKLVEPALFHSFFVVLPLLYHTPSLELIRTTNNSSGLSQFAKKLGDERELLVSVQERTLRMRDLTLASVAAAISSGLMHLSYDAGRLRCNDARPPKLPERLKYHVAGAEKLGHWFGRMSLDQAFALLWVEL